MSAPHLKLKYTSISDVSRWERGWGDISRRMLHVRQQETVSHIIWNISQHTTQKSTSYVTFWSLCYYFLCDSFLEVLRM